MESGVVGRWLRGDRERVAKGEPLVQVETDKSTVEVEAEADGILVILAQEGQTVPTGGAIADIVSAGEEPPKRNRSPVEAGEGRIAATPVAKRLAAEAGIGLAELAPGSGPLGRVHRTDVERHLDGLDRNTGGDQAIVPGTVQRITAERLAASKREIPHYYVTVEIDATACLGLAYETVGLTDVIVFATARSLRALPEINASWSDGTIIRRAHVNIGLAVSVEDGLVVPVIRDADQKTLPDLSDEIREVVRQARARELRPEQMSGGTFTISNLGMFGVTQFQAIINPPESGILAIGAIVKRPALLGGTLIEVPMLSLSLSADHRVYAGVAAARFLGELKKRLESPEL